MAGEGDFQKSPNRAEERRKRGIYAFCIAVERFHAMPMCVESLLDGFKDAGEQRGRCFGRKSRLGNMARMFIDKCCLVGKATKYCTRELLRVEGYCLAGVCCRGCGRRWA